MLIKIKPASQVPSSQITPPGIYMNRRRFLGAGLGVGVGAGLGAGLCLLSPGSALAAKRGEKLKGVVKTDYGKGLELTPYEAVSEYNNFYEFGTGKDDPVENSKNFKTVPWSLQVDGHVEKPGTYGLEDLIKPHTLEERIYRMRCVEAWSMVVPWVGIPLKDIIATFAPTSKARYVHFKTLYDPEQMPGQRRGVLKWPYEEGLRMDEALHPLTILAVGLYGEVLPNQNGAPLRLVVPWKYGFKGIKSIVGLTFTEKQPPTSWNLSGPREYGFYANVNPNVDHPRWSQSRERRIGEFFKQKTLMFNGYGEEVADLYAGMDLSRLY